MEGLIGSCENGAFVAKPSIHPRVLVGFWIAGIQSIPETAVLHMELIWGYANDGSYKAMRPVCLERILGWSKSYHISDAIFGFES